MTDEVASLRGSLTADQITVLDGIWAHYCDSPRNEWPVARSVHLILDRPRVMEAIAALPEGAVSLQVAGDQRYVLSFLGILLTSRGQEFEDALVTYLQYMRSRMLADRNVSEIRAADLATSLAIPRDDLSLLGQLVLSGRFFGHHFSGGPDWNCGLPDDADELTTIRDEDLRGYIRRRAVREAKGGGAAPAIQTIAHAQSEKASRGDFWFVLDLPLRRQLAADRQELLSVRRAKAWKSCVILAGGILEGMLLDVLSRRREAAIAAYKTLKNSAVPHLDRWTLNDLVTVANELSMLHKGAIQLSHALREFRDLVHPGRQLREGIHLTEDEADIALSVVNICFRELAAFEDRSTL